MKLPPFKLEITTFYLAGAILMCFSVIGSLWALYSVWGGIVGGDRMSRIIGVLFNVLWIGLFVFLYKMTPKNAMGMQKVVNSPEIDNMLKELSERREEPKNEIKTK